MKPKPKSFWSLIALGFASIGQGMSTFTLWPDTDYEQYARDLQKKHLAKAPGFAEYERTLDDARRQAKANAPSRKPSKQARWKKRKA